MHKLSWKGKVICITFVGISYVHNSFVREIYVHKLSLRKQVIHKICHIKIVPRIYLKNEKL
jgi:hypothetical protein